MAFVNLKKTYNTVPRSKLWKTLKLRNLDLLKIIMELYSNNIVQIKIDNHFLQPTQVTK